MLNLTTTPIRAEIDLAAVCAGKHVFSEKPLAITREELTAGSGNSSRFRICFIAHIRIRSRVAMPAKIVAFSASPRPRANSSIMLDSFLEGSRSVDAGVVIDVIRTEEADILPCRGCLRCNLLKRCIVRKDGWPELSRKILEAYILIFATPIYFHHTTSSCKKILDRFRSFVHVQITENGLIHTPHQEWNKQLVLISALGSSSDKEAQPLVDLFTSMTEMMGEGNLLHTLTGTRLAMGGQISFSSEKLADLYEKLGLPVRLAAEDAYRNTALLERARNLGRQCAE